MNQLQAKFSSFNKKEKRFSAFSKDKIKIRLNLIYLCIIKKINIKRCKVS